VLALGVLLVRDTRKDDAEPASRHGETVGRHPVAASTAESSGAGRRHEVGGGGAVWCRRLREGRARTSDVKLAKHAKKETMRMFVRVVESGNFSAVARELGIGQPTVSKQIASLEAHLGAQLLMRTSRRVVLTDAGRDFFESASKLVAELDAAESRIPQWLRGLRAPEPSGLSYDKPLCASLDGFTLHAATRAGAMDRAGREACCVTCCARRSRRSGWCRKETDWSPSPSSVRTPTAPSRWRWIRCRSCVV